MGTPSGLTARNGRTVRDELSAVDREAGAPQRAMFADPQAARFPLVASLVARVHVWRRREDTKRAGARTMRANAVRLVEWVDNMSWSTHPAIVAAVLSVSFRALTYVYVH